ncbi:MAG: endonuclease/exonuclease/phosphatase family protein [Candidatus Marinimicrobia bacterium]|nr:endonuclease/exonuclease/phosphatase family protein [Candidatus Neomarinimicrobiota bacterium]
MKKIFPILLVLTSLVFGENQSQLRLHVLFTNEINGAIHQVPARFMNPEYPPMLTGGAGAYHYVKTIREEQSGPVLLLDGGNFFQGSPLGTHDGGKTIIRWMNWMKYDALVPGVFDFILGINSLSSTALTADFPFLGANIMDDISGEQPAFVKPYILKKYEDITVGIIGLTTPNIVDEILPKNIQGLSFQSPLEVVDHWVKAVKNDGADIVIILTNLGLPYDREDRFDEFAEQVNNVEAEDLKSEELNALVLAHYAHGVDIIVTGGVSKGYDTPWIDPDTHTLVVQNYGNITGIGHIELLIDTKTKSLSGYEYPTDRGMMITLLKDDAPADPVMADSIANWVKNVTSSFKPTIPDIDKANHESAPIFEYPYDNFEIPVLGNEKSLDIMTWNLEWFPAAGDTTIEYVSEVLHDLNLDIIGLQEIKNMGWFGKLMDLIPEYGFVMSQQSSFMHQAILYRKSLISVIDYHEPFAMDDYFYAGRPPLLVNFAFNDGKSSKPITVVNLHLKCCGDGLYRRQRSLEWLHDYLIEYMDVGHDDIIVLGDLNDQLDDDPIIQSFYPFLDDPQHFYFVTEEIHLDPAQASYPTWPSFLDHIIIGKGFFDDHKQSGSIQTVQIDDYVGSWELYESTMSDHLPVLWSITYK